MDPKPQEEQKTAPDGAQPAAQVEGPATVAPIKLRIRSLNGEDLDLGYLQCELITELREILSDNVNTCFFTNYYFEHEGKRLSDYD